MSTEPKPASTVYKNAPTESRVAGIAALRDMKEKQIVKKQLTLYMMPTISKRIMAAMKPDLALGISVGSDANRVINRILTIIFGSLILGILSTLSWKYSEGGHKNEQILIAVFSISWFIFVSFVALLFAKTRLLHIVAFIIILSLCGIVSDSYTKNEITGTGPSLLIATMGFAGIVVFLLLGSYMTSGKEEELYEMKTQMQEARQKAEYMKFMEQQIEENIKKQKKELEAELDGTDATVRKKIADAFIEGILKQAAEGKIMANANQKQKQPAKKQPQVLLLPQTNDEEEAAVNT